MPPARPWHDDNDGKETYKGAGIITSDVAETMDDFALGHWLDNGRVWSRPEYAYRAARKIVTNNYFLLVKISNGTITQWAVMITKANVDQTFTSVSPPT
jgi:hypothetical protein